ncbi:MAG: Lrp/AsnC family transcriptional regulator [Candidatus Thermoplasmatota archaeon]|nr:Lrp/AsnC family transcriptional regulator [Candidatus Thermoplasmatota archaeon]
MDEIDEEILDILREDARTSYIDIGEKVGLSEGAIRNRVKKLKESGKIKRFTIETSAKTEGLVIIRAEPAKTKKAAEKIKEHSEKVYELSGEWDIVAWIHSSDINELNQKVDKIRDISGVSNTSTLIKLKEH